MIWIEARFEMAIRIMLPTLQIDLLGGFYLTHGGHPVSNLTSERLQALLAYLLLHRDRPQSRQQLAFQFWQDSSDAQARTNLRRELYALRKALPDADRFLQIDNSTLQWRSGVPFRLDVDEFETAITIAESAERVGDWERVASAFEQAIALYRGDLLPICTDEWIVPERERLRQKYLYALDSLAALAERQNNLRAAIRWAQRLLAVEPLHEGSYGILMRSHNGLDDRATALRIYHQCMTLLREELGIDPSPAMRQLYEQLLREEQFTDSTAIDIVPSLSLSSARPSVVADWGEAIDVSTFYGRKTELATLQQWAIAQSCRLILLLGMGGMGKTALSVKIAQDLASKFERVIWRSLRHAPALTVLLSDLVAFLSEQQDTKADIGRLLHWLRLHRCLVVLDNGETLFQAGDRAGQYRDGYEDYGELFRSLGETPHQSCVLITSREKPSEIALLEDRDAVQTLQLAGSTEVAHFMLAARELVGTEEEKNRLVEQYSGNPLALKIVASIIQDLFDGEIQPFLSQNTLLFSGLRCLLEQQFERLSSLERAIMYWLAINREWTAIAELAGDLFPSVARVRLLEALESLVWRNLIEKRAGTYTQQPTVMEYVTDLLTERMANELATQRLDLFNQLATIKTTVKDYLRQSQERLIVANVADRLQSSLNSGTLARHLQELLQWMRGNRILASGYAAGNLLNLCTYLNLDLTGWDFSGLTIRQAWLQSVQLLRVNFARVNFVQSTFRQTFGAIFCVAFSPDGQTLAAGDGNGNIHLWGLTDRQEQQLYEGHRNWVRAIAFSPDGSLLASASEDFTLKLWQVKTGYCVKTLEGHEDWLYSVVFGPDGTLLASNDDRTTRLWDVETGECIRVWQESGWLHCCAFSPDGTVLAMGSPHHVINLWSLATGACLLQLEGHRDWVNQLSFSADGCLLASSSADGSVKLWDVSSITGRSGNENRQNSGDRCLQTLTGHCDKVWSAVFSPNGRILATSSNDGTIRLWAVGMGQLLKILQEEGNIWSIALSPDGKLLASGSHEQAVKLWDVSEVCVESSQAQTQGRCAPIQLASGECIKTLQGYSNPVWSIAFSPDGEWVVSGSHDQRVRVWEVASGRCLKTLQGHDRSVKSVAFSSDGITLASSSSDYTINLWNAQTGQCLKTLTGHESWVWAIAFSPDGQWLASVSHDGTNRLWNVKTGQLVQVLPAQTEWIRNPAFSPDSQILAAHTQRDEILFWEVATGKIAKRIPAKTDRPGIVTFSPDGQLLAAGTAQTVQLWEIATGRCMAQWQGHQAQIWSIAFSPDGRWLITGSGDRTVRLWDVAAGEVKRILKGHRNSVIPLPLMPIVPELPAAVPMKRSKFGL